MNAEPIESKVPLDNILADRAIVEELYATNLLTSQAREFSLNLLYPRKDWGIWTSYLLLTIGVSLILSGIIYFFAFNWAKLTTLMKFAGIEGAIILCLAATYFYTLQKLIGKLFLTAAAILIGVFLAVFGQIYQSGADPYLLFTMWAIFISIWVFIAEFGALWIIWATIIQLAVGLYWVQVVYPTYEWELFIFSIFVLINIGFLIAREYGYSRGLIWLQSQWTRLALVLAILLFSIVAPLNVTAQFSTTSATLIGSLLCCVTYLAFLYYYRYQQPDLHVLSATVIAVCVLLEFLMIRVLRNLVDMAEAPFLLLMSIFSVALFTIAVMMLRKIAQTMETHHVS